MKQHNGILVVEDDENMAYLLSDLLSEQGYEVGLTGNVKHGYEKFESGRYDLCLLDIVLNDGDGIDLAKKIRQKDKDIPIIFLTSRALKSDKLLGYEVGADDYITKPFDADILLAKIAAIINRCYGKLDEKTHFNLDEYKLDFTKRLLSFKKKKIKLSSTECGILKSLFAAKGEAVSRDDIMKQVWGRSDFFVSKSLDVYITRIRKVLREDTGLNLETIHGFGYSLSS